MRRRPSRVPTEPGMTQEMWSFLDELDRRFLQNKMNATTGPAVTDDGDAGYDIGSMWFDLSADALYACLDNTTGAAVWKKLSP